MGMGAVTVEQDPIQVGSMAQSSPILSLASLAASDVMLKMASVPQADRLSKMIEILNAGQPGLGESAKRDFMRRALAMGPSRKDQAMFDAIRAALADSLTEKLLGRPGLGQTVAEVRGQTSQGVNDANALFCSYGAGIGSMVGGFLDQFGVGGSSAAGSAVRGSTAGGQIAGCNAGQLILQGQLAAQQAQASQSGAMQAAAMQQAADARFMKFVFGGAALIGVAGIGYAVLRRS
jgi:hypothetical protein